MIKAFKGTSTVDYPDKLASVVFTGGCNWRCPFCYNIDLVLPERLKQLSDIPENEIISQLKRRQGFIHGVVITGGEPTIWGDRLISFIKRVRKETNLLIKLDTNGSNPDVVQELLPYLDYIAIDFKTGPEKYHILGGNFETVQKTFSIVQDVPHEIRLTLAMITEEDLEQMLPYLENKVIAVQKFFHGVNTLDPNFTPSKISPEYVCERVGQVAKKLLRRL